MPVSVTEKYCAAHEQRGQAREAKFAKDRESRRLRYKGTSSARGYGYRWKKLRDRYIAQHPHCEECFKAGQVVIATEVDHIIPLRGDQALLYDERNLQSLCKSCHSRKSAREDGGFGNSKNL